MAEILKNCPFLDIIYQKSYSLGAGLQSCPLCCFLKQKLEFEEFSRCLHGNLKQIVLFKMLSKKAALGTVQNFLLGGGGKMPIKNAYSPHTIFHKILETHHRASVKNWYPPPPGD